MAIRYNDITFEMLSRIKDKNNHVKDILILGGEALELFQLKKKMR